MKLLSTLLFGLLLAPCQSFGTQLSRNDFLASGAALATALVGAPSAMAGDKDDYVKGSKDDPAVQAKLSVCMYECTKPKGSEQKSRAECLPECKAKCITARPAPKA